MLFRSVWVNTYRSTSYTSPFGGYKSSGLGRENGQQAIEVFIRMVEVDNETVETHLALGNLFRRRGEVDRAIRIHQNLIARRTLSQGQRAHALLELGMDYMRSGLLDRAEKLFLELVDLDLYQNEAYFNLLEIYQQEKDWENAIIIAKKFETVSGKNLNSMIAQFFCETVAKCVGVRAWFCGCGGNPLWEVLF